MYIRWGALRDPIKSLSFLIFTSLPYHPALYNKQYLGTWRGDRLIQNYKMIMSIMVYQLRGTSIYIKWRVGSFV